MDLLNEVEIFDEVMERDTTPLDEEEVKQTFIITLLFVFVFIFP